MKCKFCGRTMTGYRHQCSKFPSAPASCSPETCKQVFAEFRQRFHELFDEERRRTKAAMLREFPIGSAVTWRHGLLTVKGRVVHISDWSYDTIEVRRDRTKKGAISKKAHELTPVNSVLNDQGS